MVDTNRKRNLPKTQVDTLTVPKLIQEDLLADLRHLITETRSAVAVTINAGLTLLYWRIGERIHQEILGKERAEYGEQIVHALSAQLRLEFGFVWQAPGCFRACARLIRRYEKIDKIAARAFRGIHARSISIPGLSSP